MVFAWGVNKSWKSLWYVSPSDYAKTLHEDLQLRKVLLESKETRSADIANIHITRHPQEG